jgi:acetylornithine deacetylase
MSQNNAVALPAGARERIEEAVETAFEQQIATTAAFALTDTRFYGLDYGIPALCFGAKAENVHGFNERVALDSLKKVTKTLALFIAGWCGVEAA